MRVDTFIGVILCHDGKVAVPGQLYEVGSSGSVSHLIMEVNEPIYLGLVELL